MNAAELFVPLAAVLILLTGMIKKTDIFSEFSAGVREGLNTAVDIIPPLILLVTSVGMLRASGLLDFVTEIISPFLEKIGFPPECLPLAVIRPFSGSGAVAVFESILRDNPTSTFAERVASVMSASTETTFYTLAVYFSAIKSKNTRHTLVSSLAGDFTAFIMSAVSVKIFFGV